MFFKICDLLTILIGASSIFMIGRAVDVAPGIPKIPTNPNEVDFLDGQHKNESGDFLNFGLERSDSKQRFPLQYLENSERILQSKVNVLARLFKIHVDRLRDKTDEVELVFLIDASASVGLENFRSELNFVRKLLSDFTVERNATRVAVVTFAGRRNIIRHIDQISGADESEQKCQLLNKQLSNVNYTGGGTYTRGALLEALAILQNSRENSEKVVFLITDGFSNSGDPRPAAKHLKNIGATIFTFGIRTGNIEELHDIASQPGYTHSYLLDSFSELEALARRALHRDLKAGRYVPVKIRSDCDWLCSSRNNNTNETLEGCCDELATCACGTATGHYACICPRGYFGSGLKGFCQPCPNGTFDPGDALSNSGSSCVSCANVNHVTMKIPALSPADCVCAPGFVTDGNNCEAIRCPKLKVPENGYFVKASACSNVVNVACGLRCRIGFNLVGDSIRLCRNDGVWSGIEPQCLLKTCAALRAPAHGRMRCEHEENEEEIKITNLTAYPIDTRCQFKCNTGFQLRGSKVRNCLPLSRWDGLKVSCKQIKCDPLKRLAHGSVSPETCTGLKKLPFGTNCTFSCEKGFVLVGPKMRHCSGKHGMWSQRHSVSQCIDKTPPTIACPADATWETLPGKDYANVSWTVPIATDNSGKVPEVWTKPHLRLPWKAKIGSHKIVYVAQDASGNKAKCKFVAHVVDKEPPQVENCVDPPIFLSVSKSMKENVTWNEPIFHDNSGSPVKIQKSHSRPECNCHFGRTQIFYNATDVFDNSVSCVMNITIQDACKDIPILSNGQTNCQTIEDDAVQCVVTCEDGYGFTEDQIDYAENMILTCGLNETAWNTTFFPDCSVTKIPNSIGREVKVILQGNNSFCENSTIINQLTDRITGDLASNMIDICGNDIDCNLVKYDPNCELDLLEGNDVSNGIEVRRRRKRFSSNDRLEDMEIRKFSRFRRTTTKNLGNNKPKNRSRVKRKKGKIEIKLRFIGKIIAENRDNPALGIQKLREKIESMSKSGELNLLNDKTYQEIAKLALNLNTIFKDPQEICEIGHVLKKKNCTKCPMGTFHNTTREQCQACPFGEFQNSTAMSKCIKCPVNTFTRKMHSKKLSDCLPLCRPGFFSRRKVNQISSVGLEPCTSCEIAFYQPLYGKTFCQKCPNNKTTDGRGFKGVNDCFEPKKIQDPCSQMPCLNGGSCTSENGSFICECPEHYVGSTCEKRKNPCESSPCLNEGDCNIGQSIDSAKITYSCNCKPGFTGKSCEIYIDECSFNRCQNGGTCISNERDFTCACRDGFEGDYCEVIVNHCEPWTCEERSTCITVDGTWKCLCKPGFLGLRCNLLPCDWIPCHPKAICVNVEAVDATRQSYRCECPDGYEGEDCSIRINYCNGSSCLNGGTCVNGLLNYTCECPMTFNGTNCETELSSDFVLHFSEVGTNAYVTLEGPRKNLTAFTVCLWLQSVDTFNYGTVLSYATEYNDNALTLTDYNGFVLYVNGEKVVTDITLNDGYWHFLCVNWKSDYGSWNAYVDGHLRDNGTNLAKNSFIIGNGTFVIGQEQDRLGGGFSASEAFLGKLSYLDFWDTSLSIETIIWMSNSCEKYHGSIFAWAQTKLRIRGNVAIEDGIFCRGCRTPTAPSKGSIIIHEDKSEVLYMCEAGYSVKVGNWVGSTYTVKCLKHGEWEGLYTPICTKVKCGYPGYFPRGHVNGRSFMYGDEIHYSCEDGYALRGNPHRICNADGNWSGLQPICIGITCRNLLAPENGDIEYVIEEHERDDISILQVGQQLEFKCEAGFQLSGEKFLTCLESGKWDYDRPECVPSGCLSPKLIKNGYLSSKQSTILPIFKKFNRTSTVGPASTPAIPENGPSMGNESSFYSFGDVVGFSCDEGYKFFGNRNLLVEFRLQCSTNGTWTGFVPDCVRLKCSPPSYVENGRIFLLHEENATKTEISIKKNIGQTIFSKIHDFNETSGMDKDIVDIFEEISVDDDKIINDKNHDNEDDDEEKMEFVAGTKILIICDRGHGRRQKLSRICLESEIWSAEEPECLKNHCPIEDHPILGQLTADKFNDSETTNLFYDNTEEKKIEAKNWNIRGIFSNNVAFVLEGSQYEDRVVFSCKDDAKMMDLRNIGGDENIGNLTWRCGEGGKWKIENQKLNELDIAKVLVNDTDICKDIHCDAILRPANGYIANASNTTAEMMSAEKKINDTLNFRCFNGYEIHGNDNLTCLPNGTWSSTVPSCTPVTCGNPPKISNALLEDASPIIQTHISGKKITYKCVQGYRIVGQASSKCLANGKWSRFHGKCSKISCGKPTIPTGVMISGRSFLYQEKLEYICPGGGTKSSIICKSDGKWSDPLPCNRGG